MDGLGFILVVVGPGVIEAAEVVGVGRFVMDLSAGLLRFVAAGGVVERGADLSSLATNTVNLVCVWRSRGVMETYTELAETRVMLGGRYVSVAIPTDQQRYIAASSTALL